MMKIDKDKLIIGAAGPVLALVSSFVLTVLVLLATGLDPIEPIRLMIDNAGYSDVQVLIVNYTGILYLAALGVAIGFRMNLFNIGVEGQYRLAAMVSALVGAAVDLPGPLHILVIVLVAIATGALWAGIAGILKTTRGVSEVVSTIMLNAITTSLVAWLILPKNFGVQPAGSNDLTTGQIPESGWFPGIDMGEGGQIYGFTFVALALGVVYWFVINRTRFGFDLRATGESESAAQASGVDAKKMIITAMLISGGLAGLAGMPILLGESHTYSLAFPVGVGFTAITVALLGRNHPVGILFAALLFAFLEKASSSLDIAGYPKEITQIMQGIIVIAVVVSYELVRRYGTRRQQQKVGEELAAGGAIKTDKEVSA
ncbi:MULTISPECIES: ABC transporter permease [Streptomyces]|jgi:general nucleoside transport system permease protein|uniref:Simple sugar transport system permease protein n=1 Tax=Streptomyces nymphaeiformis TaxID=2663842 RepID=A0A7W7XCA2_9ACTN|nr:ABC transporter permease [Streptomyces nymphaeiformis]MBB4983464.1 simple sugar transport system permease protein [Streptomyces nymphaeiformis]